MYKLSAGKAEEDLGRGGAGFSEKCRLRFLNHGELSVHPVLLGTQKVCGSPSNTGKKGSNNVLLTAFWAVSVFSS